MKKPLVILLALGAAGSAMAVDIARVISSTPVMQQVAVPRQVCSNQEVLVQQPKSGAGAVVGAIAGGALGSAAGGRGPGRAAATVLGAVGGAVLGDRIEGSPEPELRSVQRCTTQTVYENRAVAYNVVYEYAGKQYNTQLPHDPGPTLALQIGPVGATSSNEPQQQSYAADIPVYSEPPPLVVAQPVYPAPVYYPRPYYYPPVTLDLGFGYWGGYRSGYRGHHHWH
ncbi:MAG: glycine zipper 2TM domain-containing protein [Rhodoferax sp.]|nr:glycine zipper 2TM domain-containing protein [Rhodoferax sp.]